MSKGDDTARVQPWDGSPTEKCDHIGCTARPVVHFEFTTAEEWAAETDLCAEHLAEVAEQARAFAVAVGALPPTTQLDRNVLAAMQEYMT